MGAIRQQLREQGREQLAAIARGDPDAPQVSAEEFRAGFERYVNEWLANTGQAHPGAPFKMDFTSEGSPSPDTRHGRRLTDQQPRTVHVAGLQAATLRRPPLSWSDAAALPSVGAWCSCCRGQRWWSEARDPTGWRCLQCHPSRHLGAGDVQEVQT